VNISSRTTSNRWQTNAFQKHFEFINILNSKEQKLIKNNLSNYQIIFSCKLLLKKRNQSLYKCQNKEINKRHITSKGEEVRILS